MKWGLPLPGENRIPNMLYHLPAETFDLLAKVRHKCNLNILLNSRPAEKCGYADCVTLLFQYAQLSLFRH